MNEQSGRIIVLGSAYDEAVLERELGPGDTIFFDGHTSAFVRDVDGEIEELTPEEHPDYVEIGSYHGLPQEPDEPDLDGDDYLVGRLGRIGPLYFDHQKDPLQWEWCGRLESDDAAIDDVCGADFNFQQS
jgi:hypothetical protein